jgi:surfeit locus 1 family protein
MHFRLPKIRVHLFGYLFSPGWTATFATALLLPLLMSMGTWQLDRAAQKRAIEADFNRRAKIMLIGDLKDFHNTALRYQALQVSGHFDNDHTIYIDNKTYQQRHGVHILTPFILANENKVILVNRGFMTVTDRHQLPFPLKITGQRTLTGLISFPSKPFLLKKEAWNKQWPLLAQGIDLQDIEGKLKAALLPFILLQNSADESALIQDWHPVNFPSYRHTGYAVQWFALALTLLIIYLRLNLKKVK